MKKYLYLLLMPLLVIASCEKPEIEPEQDQVVGKITLKSDAAIVLSDEGTSEQVEFTATLDWKAVSDQEWLTVTPKAGLAGDASVTMSAEKNTLEESRNAIVTLTCGEDTKTIEVTQKQAGALLLTQSSIEVAAEGGKITITAKSNSNATAAVDAAAASWITAVTTKALVEYDFYFEIAANESEMPRNGKIVFSNADGKSETVTIVQEGMYVEPDVTDLVAECVAITSSTLVFKWEENLETSELVKHAFTATLYKDAACTVVDQSFDFPSDCAAWNNNTPKYVFGGLQPSTDYWFKVFDTTADLESEPIKCTTDPFTHVLMPQTITSTGVVLAEDFGEIRWGFDHMTNAVGFSPSDKSGFANTAVEGFNNSGSKEFEFKSFGDAIKKSRLNGWLLDTYGFVHPGYIKLGTEKAGGWLLTPAFTVPEGKKAVVKITVTAARFDTNQSDDWMLAVIPEKDAGAGKDGEHTAYFNWPDTYDNTLYQHIIFDNTDWATKSVQGLVVNSGDRIAFGSAMALKNNVRRGYISDMIVEVLEIVDIDDINRTTKVSIIGDSISTFKGWSDSSKGNAYYPRTDCDVTYVNQTWWHRLIYNYMSTGVFEKNISAGNTTIVQNTTGDKSEYWYGWDFGTRVQNLGLGDPDVIMVFGGTNDYGHTLYDDTTEELIDGVEMGATSFPTSSEARLAELVATAKAATTVAEADALDGTTYAGACIRLIQMLRVRHPEAKIVFIIGDYVYSGMGEAARKIVDSFSDEYVRKVDILGKYGYKANSAIKKFDYAHPTAAGMDVIASYVYEQVGEWIDENN